MGWSTSRDIQLVSGFDKIATQRMHWHPEGQVWSSNIQKYSSSPYGQSGNESHASSGETHISEFLHFTYPGHDVLLQLCSSDPFGHSHFPLHTYLWGIQYDSGHLKYFLWHIHKISYKCIYGVVRWQLHTKMVKFKTLLKTFIFLVTKEYMSCSLVHRMRGTDYSCFSLFLVHHGILDSPFSTVELQCKILLPSWHSMLIWDRLQCKILLPMLIWDIMLRLCMIFWWNMGTFWGPSIIVHKIDYTIMIIKCYPIIRRQCLNNNERISAIHSCTHPSKF